MSSKKKKEKRQSIGGQPAAAAESSRPAASGGEDDEEGEEGQHIQPGGDPEPECLLRPNATTVMLIERRSQMVGQFNGDEREFTPWKWRLLHHLTRLKLDHTLQRTPPEEDCGVPDPNASRAEERKRKELYQKRCEEDCSAIDEICCTIGNGPLQKIMDCQYAKQCMDALVRAYQRSGTLVAMSIRRQLFSLGEKQFASLAELFKEHGRLCYQLEQADPVSTHLEKVQTLLGAIPDRFRHVVAAILMLPEVVLRTKPLDDIQRMLLDAEILQKPQQSTPTPENTAMIANKKQVQCFGCKEYGHYRNKCPQEKKKKAANTKRAVFEAMKGKKQHALMAGNSTGKQLRCVVDSGASTHMFNSDTPISNRRELENEVIITTAKENQQLKANVAGDVKLRSVIGYNKMKTLTLYNCLIIPGLQENLISVKRVVSLGKEVLFSGNEVIIKEKSGEVIAKGKLMDGLYFLDVLPPLADENALFSKNYSMVHWHKRYGHLGWSNLEKLFKNEMVDGFDIRSEEFNQRRQLCNSCLFGKQTREKFKNMELPRSSKPLETIHSDVCGYFEKSTYDGFRYFVTFIDDYTHFTVVYLLGHKSEVLNRFKQFEAMASAHFGQKIVYFRTDNGTEYYGNDFLEYCKNKGIQMIATVPYTPQQNGVSERMNRTLLDKARTMLQESEMPKELWGEAVFVATYLTNRSPTSALLENKTPYEMWFGRRPNVNKLRIFGCSAYAQIPKEKRKKLDKRSKLLRFVGYANNGFRLWNDATRSVEISRDVVFDEEQQFTIENEVNDHLNTDKDITVNESFDSEIVISTSQDLPTTETTHFDSVSLEDSFITADDGDDTVDIIDDHEEVRRSGRDRRPPEWMNDYETAFCAEEVPQLVELLKKRDDWPKWQEAIADELKSLMDNHG